MKRETHLSGDGALLEDHGVLREGSGLVTEDVLDLSETEGGKKKERREVRLRSISKEKRKNSNSLVRKIPTPRQGPRIRRPVPDLVVPVDEESLSGSNELDGDVERDGDDVLEGDERVEEGDESVERRVVVRRVVVESPVGVLTIPGDLVEVIDDSTDHSGDSEKHEGEEAGEKEERKTRQFEPREGKSNRPVGRETYT